jgi:hypothetical protein
MERRGGHRTARFSRRISSALPLGIVATLRTKRVRLRFAVMPLTQRSTSRKVRSRFAVAGGPAMVARCTVRGQLAAQRAHHMGTPVQASGAPNSCRKCDDIIRQLKVVDLFSGFRAESQDFADGNIRPHARIFSGIWPRPSDHRRTVHIRALWRLRRGAAADRTDAPSPVREFPRRDRSGVRGSC